MKFIHMYAGKICHTDQEWFILNVKPILFYLHRMVDFWCFFCKMIASWYTVERSYENYDWIMAIEFVIARSSAKRERHQIQYNFFSDTSGNECYSFFLRLLIRSPLYQKRDVIGLLVEMDYIMSVDFKQNLDETERKKLSTFSTLLTWQTEALSKE